jgi:hypothetical protein
MLENTYVNHEDLSLNSAVTDTEQAMKIKIRQRKPNYGATNGYATQRFNTKVSKPTEPIKLSTAQATQHLF